MSTTITSPPYSRRSGYFRKRSIRTGLLDWTKKKTKTKTKKTKKKKPQNENVVKRFVL